MCHSHISFIFRLDKAQVEIDEAISSSDMYSNYVLRISDREASREKREIRKYNDVRPLP